MPVEVKVLYAPTCANNLTWLDKVNELIRQIDGNIAVEEIDVSQHPEALERYWLDSWQQFKDGYIHYFFIVAVNDKPIDWYWDKGKLKEAILREL